MGDALNAERWPEVRKDRRRLAIMRLLKFCKGERKPATITLMRSYLADLERQGNLWPETREALRWFVVEARRRSEPASGGAGRAQLGLRRGEKGPMPRASASACVGPPPKRDGGDQGASAWETALVEALRVGGKQWRTEQCYRD